VVHGRSAELGETRGGENLQNPKSSVRTFPRISSNNYSIITHLVSRRRRLSLGRHFWG
jgi:hypothetical protein